MPNLHAVLSIHDVAPHTLERVEKIIDKLPEKAHKHLILLVIPGLSWQKEQVETLRQFQKQGFILAGHGWYHKAKNIRSFYHKCHSLFVSRDVAEHLSLNENEILEMMQRNRSWFAEHELDIPDCYVPPAWALGNISRSALQQSGFRYIETTGGYIDSTSKQSKTFPLIGFEADTPLRKYTLLAWNKINAMLSSKTKPLRISIHPYDDSYLLADSMWSWLHSVDAFHSYRSLFD